MSNRTDIVVETDNAEGQVLLSASRVYDLTEDKTQDTINGEIRNTLNQLESGLAIPQSGDNASKPIPVGAFIYLTGNSNQTDFPNGFYQNTSGSAIGSGATFTLSNLTRCYQETGALNNLTMRLDNFVVSGENYPATSKPVGLKIIQPTSTNQGYPTIYFPVLSVVYSSSRGFQLIVLSDSVKARAINNGDWTPWFDV